MENILSLLEWKMPIIWLCNVLLLIIIICCLIDYSFIKSSGTNMHNRICNKLLQQFEEKLTELFFLCVFSFWHLVFSNKIFCPTKLIYWIVIVDQYMIFENPVLISYRAWL